MIQMNTSKSARQVGRKADSIGRGVISYTHIPETHLQNLPLSENPAARDQILLSKLLI
jgi:hypothetical protein